MGHFDRDNADSRSGHVGLCPTAEARQGICNYRPFGIMLFARACSLPKTGCHPGSWSGAGFFGIMLCAVRSEKLRRDVERHRVLRLSVSIRLPVPSAFMMKIWPYCWKVLS